MPSPVFLLTAAIPGFCLAGALAAFCYGWARHSWAPFLHFVVISLAMASYSLANLCLQTTDRPVLAVEFFRWMDLSALPAVVVLPYLFRRLMNQRACWVDHALAALVALSAVVPLVRPLGYWDRLDAMHPIDLGGWGVIYQPLGAMNPLRFVVQILAVMNFLLCLSIAWRGRRAHPAVARWMFVMPLLLIPAIIYQHGLFRGWWQGPMVATYAALALYLMLAATVFAREREMIAERNTLFDSLAEREAKLAALTNFSVGFAGLLDPQGRVVLANHAALAAVGATPEAVNGRPFAETPWWTHDAAQQERLRTAIGLAASGQADRFQATHRVADGQEITVDFSLTPYRSEDGTLRYLIAEGRDITALVKYQERLREGHRLEAVGQLAGGVAHDFNNVLGGIMSATELALLRAEKGEDVRQHLGMILRSTNRAADLTRNLLSFSRRGKSQELAFGINSLARDTLAVLARTLGPNIQIVSRLEAQPDQLRGDPAEIQSSVLNLCLNARDAMPDGGTLTLRTACETLDAARADRLPLALSPGRYITITISDTGTGIPAEIRSRIFEPFFTTKPPGRGTGLGLAAVQGAVHAHHGAIEVQSEPGRGATFTVYLPADAGQPERAAPTAPSANLPARPPASRGRAVVVDDEALVRELTAELLKQLGFQVQAYRDPLQARQDLPGFNDVRLVVLDLAMPHLDGLGLYREIRKLKPEVAIIIATGFAGDRLQALEDPRLATLAKPFRMAQLTEALARLGV